MEYYKEYFSLEDIEKKFEEYCQENNVDDLALVNRFRITMEFQYDKIFECSKDDVVDALRQFIEFIYPIVFKIKDLELERDIIEIRLTEIGWKFHCHDWEKKR